MLKLHKPEPCFHKILQGCLLLTWLVLATHPTSTAEGVTLDRYTETFLVDGETRFCRRREKSEACPLDHEIGPCDHNMTLVSCKPCDIDNRYRLCMSVYSDIDYVKCQKLDLECLPEQELILHTYPNGSCYNHTCECRASDGYVKDGEDCIKLRLKCGVNFSVIDGKCQPCPAGTHKLSVGFEPCVPIPDPATPPTPPGSPGTEEPATNKSTSLPQEGGSRSQGEGSGSQGETTPAQEHNPETGGDDEDTRTTKEDENNDDYLVVVLIAVGAFVVIVIIVVVTVIVMCGHKKTGCLFCCNHCCICSTTTTNYGEPIPSKDPEGPDPEPGETTVGGPQPDERPSSPPRYQSADFPAKNVRSPRSKPTIDNTGSHQDVNPCLEEVIHMEPREQDVRPPSTHTSSSQSWSFPTLATREGSSLLNNNDPVTRRTAEDRMALLDLDNTEVAPPTATATTATTTAAAGATTLTGTALGDDINTQQAFSDVSDDLRNFKFGSAFSIISKT